MVDDDHDVRRLVQDVLEIEGYEVDTASDGAEALHHVEFDRPDCVVLDAMMPGMSGYEVLAVLRARESGTTLLPVVMLTAAADDAHAWQAWSGGVDYFLGKPFDAAELLRFLDELFNGRLAASEAG